MVHSKYISYILAGYANNRDYYYLVNYDKYLPGMQCKIHKQLRPFLATHNKYFSPFYGKYFCPFHYHFMKEGCTITIANQSQLYHKLFFALYCNNSIILNSCLWWTFHMHCSRQYHIPHYICDQLCLSHHICTQWHRIVFITNP